MENKAIKNMAYWKKKNNIPGIEALEDSGLTDGRAGSSPFQAVQPNAMPKPPPPPPPAAKPLSNGARSGGVGAASTAIQAKVDAKIDEKVEKAVSGDDGSGLAMKSPMKAGPETKQVDVDDLDSEDSEQEFEGIKNDHDVDDDGVPQTDPEGYWKKAAKHGIYPKGKSPTKIYKDGKRRKNYKY